MKASENGHLECLHYCLENGCPSPNFTRVLVHPAVVPYLYHVRMACISSGINAVTVMIHRRQHVRRALILLRCATILLGAYRRACDRVYSPDGVGYREAETSFRETVNRV